MFSLKSELFKKQQEVTSQSAGQASVTAVRKQHRIKTPGDAVEPVIPENEKNKGVEERNRKDIEKTAEEEDKSKMVKSVLEAKAKLYEKMTSGDVLPDEESSSIFLVDFEQKSIEARMKRKNKNLDSKPKLGVNVASELGAEIEKASNEGEDMVEYTDGLGRTRMCRRKDLPRMQKIDEKLGIEKKVEKKDKTLLSDDMRREMEREKWEEEAYAEVNGPLHYANVREGEIRELGVGYYSFSTDQETRDTQMKMLKKMREETKKERENVKAVERKKRTALQARLEKVRLRRIKKLKSEGKEIPAELLKPVELPTETEEKKNEEIVNNDITIAEVTKRNDSDRRIREWDRGKEWTPAEPQKPPKSWNNPRDERPDEFAPPSFYFNSKKSKIVKGDETNEYNSSDEEPTAPSSDGAKETPSDLISRIRKELTQVASSSARSDDDTLLPPGEESSILPKPPMGGKSPSKNSEISSQDVTVRDDSAVSNDSATPTDNTDGLYVPSSDKPILMKVKTLPRKNSVLQTKPAFSDD